LLSRQEKSNACLKDEVVAWYYISMCRWMAGQFSFGKTEICMHVHVSLCQRRTALLFVNPTSASLPLIPHARVATVVRATVLLYCMICTRIWICQGKEKGYAETIPVQVPFSPAHGFVVPVPSHHQPSTEDEGLNRSSWSFVMPNST
jgi:hypothetical protein